MRRVCIYNEAVKGVVIIDGPDAVGKTTLAKKVLDGDETGYVHLTYPEGPDPDKTLWKMQWMALVKASIRLGQNKLTVIDRHWMSAQVYERVYRKSQCMNNAECRGWDRVIQRLCGIYVLCAPESLSAYERHVKMTKTDGRDELYTSDEKILEVADAFRELWLGNPFAARWQLRDYLGSLSKSGMHDRDDAILYDIDLHGDLMDDVIQDIKIKLDHQIGTQYPPALQHGSPNYLGHPCRARVLFVGEQINPKKPGPWPFVDYGGSSRVLGDVLHELGWDETQGLWTNAIADDQHINQLLQHYPHLKVIALGVEASRHLSFHRINHQAVMHPAYAKRFNRVPEFKDQLEAAIYD